LIQFRKYIIAQHYPVPAKRVAWGNHYREGRSIEIGKGASLSEADSVEIIIEEQKKKSSQQEISCTIGDQPQLYTINVRRTLAIGELRERIASAHKGCPIAAVAYAGAEIDDGNPLEDWLVRTNVAPFQIVTGKLMQVILGWRETEVHMAARATWIEKEFAEAAKQHLHCTGRILAERQGLSTWEIRAGFLYAVLETKRMDINLHDTEWKIHKIQIEGDRSIQDLQDYVRARYHVPHGTN
jgi:hypothetical protein